jgi:membrane associated rhomboid family serine protease
MGGYFVLARHRGWDTSTVVPLLLVNLVFSFVDPAIDWRAHVGGLVVGAVTARIVVATEDLAPGRRRVVEPAALVGVLAVITGASLIGAGRF